MNRRDKKQSNLIRPRYAFCVFAVILALAGISLVLNQLVFAPAVEKYEKRRECDPVISPDGLLYVSFFYNESDEKNAVIASFPGSQYPIKEIAIDGKYDSIPIYKIGAEACMDSYFLEKATIKNGIEIIEDNAFSNCPSLKEIYIAPTVKNISNSAFLNSRSVKILSTDESYAASYANKHNIPFESCNESVFKESEKEITLIPETVSEKCEDTWMYNTFLNGKELQAAIIYYMPPYISETQVAEVPSDLAGVPVCAIGRNAFQKNADLLEVYVPETVITIGEGAFADNITDKKIYLTENVTQIAPTAFFGSEDTITICAPKGSYAEQFAKEHNIKFEECFSANNVN